MRGEILDILTEVKKPINRATLLKLLEVKGVDTTYNSLNVTLTGLKNEHKITYLEDGLIKPVDPIESQRETIEKMLEGKSEEEVREALIYYIALVNLLEKLKTNKRKIKKFLHYHQQFKNNIESEK